jgi:hypothetical protein
MKGQSEHCPQILTNVQPKAKKHTGLRRAPKFYNKTIHGKQITLEIAKKSALICFENSHVLSRIGPGSNTMVLICVSSIFLQLYMMRRENKNHISVARAQACID